MPLTRERTDMSELLNISGLSIRFDKGPLVVDDLSLSINKGQTLALVGESGSGKSVSALSVLRLLDERHADYPSGSITYQGEDLLKAPEKRLRQIRGRKISMIFQESMTSLNPLHTVEKQITETLELHMGLRGEQARARCMELLARVAIRDPDRRLRSYPTKLPVGRNHRLITAWPLAKNPRLRSAANPT